MLRFLRNTPLKNRNIRNNQTLSTIFSLLIHMKTEFKFAFKEVLDFENRCHLCPLFLRAPA